MMQLIRTAQLSMAAVTFILINTVTSAVYYVYPLNGTPMHDVNDALFQHLIEGIKEYAIFMISVDGIIVTWNPGVKRLLGYEEGEFIGKPFSLIFTDEDTKLNIPESELAAVKNSGKAEDERWHKKRDGSVFWASGLVTLMKEPHGTINGFTKIMRDQTQKKQFEERMAEQANALAIANTELTNFAGVLSHDLKAPLQTVQGFAHVLQDQKGLDQEAKESVHYIVDGTKRMINLVNELLEYTTLVKSDAALSFVDTAALLQEVLVALTATITDRNATVHATALPTVWANSVQLGRVFQNLIENAIKYASHDRTAQIKISARDGESETIFSVEDNGIGINQQEIAQLFTLFGRLHPEASVPGKGIGLSTCRKIIEGFGGRMWVRSSPNKGSVFSFSVPHPAEVNAKATEMNEAVTQGVEAGANLTP